MLQLHDRVELLRNSILSCERLESTVQRKGHLAAKLPNYRLCDPITAHTADLIASGNPFQTAIMRCRSASSDDKKRQLGPAVCSARAAQGCWQFSQRQQAISVRSEQDAGSIPATRALPVPRVEIHQTASARRRR
jgi:hypothetical protein